MADSNKNYKSARIKNDTYKKLKALAVEEEIPLTRLLDKLLDKYLQ